MCRRIVFAFLKYHKKKKKKNYRIQKLDYIFNANVRLPRSRDRGVLAHGVSWPRGVFISQFLGRNLIAILYLFRKLIMSAFCFVVNYIHRLTAPAAFSQCGVVGTSWHIFDWPSWHIYFQSTKNQESI